MGTTSTPSTSTISRASSGCARPLATISRFSLADVIPVMAAASLPVPRLTRRWSRARRARRRLRRTGAAPSSRCRAAPGRRARGGPRRRCSHRSRASGQPRRRAPPRSRAGWCRDRRWRHRDRGAPEELRAGQQGDVGRELGRHVDPRAGGIDDGHAGPHPPRQHAAVELRAERGQLRPVVDALGLPDVVRPDAPPGGRPRARSPGRRSGTSRPARCRSDRGPARRRAQPRRTRRCRS